MSHLRAAAGGSSDGLPASHTLLLSGRRRPWASPLPPAAALRGGEESPVRCALDGEEERHEEEERGSAHSPVIVKSFPNLLREEEQIERKRGEEQIEGKREEEVRGAGRAGGAVEMRVAARWRQRWAARSACGSCGSCGIFVSAQCAR